MSRDFFVPDHRESLGADQREALCRPNRHMPPFPLSWRTLRKGGNLSRARPSFGRGLRTLDRFPPFRNMKRERGPGSQGRAPWRSMRQRLMRAFSALSAPKRYSLRLLPTDSSATVAILPSALRSRPAPRVPIGVLNAEGCCHLSCGLQESHDSLATRRDPAVTPTRRLHMSLSRSNLFKLRCPQLRCYSGGLLRPAVIQRIINFSGHPQPMEQHG